MCKMWPKRRATHGVLLGSLLLGLGYWLFADIVLFKWSVFRLRMLEQGQTAQSTIDRYRGVIVRQPEAAIQVAIHELEIGQLGGNAVGPIWILRTFPEEAAIAIRRRLAEFDSKSLTYPQRIFNLECGLFAICGVEEALHMLIRDGQHLDLDTVRNRQMLDLVELRCRRIYPEGDVPPLLAFENGKTVFSSFWLNLSDTGQY